MWLKGHSRSAPKVARVNHSSAHWCIFIMTCILHPQRCSFFVTAMTNYALLSLFVRSSVPDSMSCVENDDHKKWYYFYFLWFVSASTHTYTLMWICKQGEMITLGRIKKHEKKTSQGRRYIQDLRLILNCCLDPGSQDRLFAQRNMSIPWAFTRTLGRRMLHPFDNISLSWCCFCPGSPKNTKLKNSSTDITYNRVPSYFQKKDVICLSHSDVTSFSPQLLLQLRLLGDEGFYLLVDGFWTYKFKNKDWLAFLLHLHLVDGEGIRLLVYVFWVDVFNKRVYIFGFAISSFNLSFFVQILKLYSLSTFRVFIQTINNLKAFD